MGYFYNDYKDGDTIADAFDQKVASDSKAAGGDCYTSLTALAARQAFGSLVFTNTPDAPYVSRLTHCACSPGPCTDVQPPLTRSS